MIDLWRLLRKGRGKERERERVHGMPNKWIISAVHPYAVFVQNEEMKFQKYLYKMLNRLWLFNDLSQSSSSRPSFVKWRCQQIPPREWCNVFDIKYILYPRSPIIDSKALAFPTSHWVLVAWINLTFSLFCSAYKIDSLNSYVLLFGWVSGHNRW